MRSILRSMTFDELTDHMHRINNRVPLSELNEMEDYDPEDPFYDYYYEPVDTNNDITVFGARVSTPPPSAYGDLQNYPRSGPSHSGGREPRAKQLTALPL